MAAPTLHKVTSAFDERNMFLQVALGTIALLRRFRVLVRRYAPPRLPSRDVAAPRQSAERGDDAVLLMALGIVALSERLMHQRVALRSRPPAGRPTTATPAPAAPPGRLLE